MAELGRALQSLGPAFRQRERVAAFRGDSATSGTVGDLLGPAQEPPIARSPEQRRALIPTTTRAPWAAIAGIVLVAVAALLLLIPAFWNGSIFYYWDSLDYVDFPFSWQMPAYRTAPYGLFAGIGRLSGTLWTVAVVQALLAAYVLYETVAVFAPGADRLERRWRFYLPLVLALAVLTALPWDAGELMPDIFTGIVVLAVAVLAFGGEQLGRTRRLAVALILVLGVAVHTSHLGLAAGLMLALSAGRWLLRGRWSELRPRLIVPAIATLLAMGTVVTVHWVALGRPFITQPSSVLMLARLVQDGIARRFLDDACPRGEAYTLCAYRDRFPMNANAFLWDEDSIADQLGGWEALEGPASDILWKSIKRYPLLHVEAVVRLTGQQLAMFRTGDGVEPDIDPIISEALQRDYPRDFKRYEGSKELHSIDFDPINDLHVPVGAVAEVLVLPLLWLAWRRRDAIGFGLQLTLALALLGNAFICGALSNPNDRYQARVVWVAVAALVIGGARLGSARTRGARPDQAAEEGGD